MIWATISVSPKFNEETILFSCDVMIDPLSKTNFLFEDIIFFEGNGVTRGVLYTDAVCYSWRCVKVKRSWKR